MAIARLIMTALVTPFVMSGCTSIVTAPIEIAGATASAIIDVTGSAVHAVAGDDEDNDDDK